MPTRRTHKAGETHAGITKSSSKDVKVKLEQLPTIADGNTAALAARVDGLLA